MEPITVLLSTTASARLTPDFCWSASAVAASRTRVVVNGPVAPRATIHWSAPNNATIAGVSSCTERRIPSIASAMPNTSDVTTTAITNRRARNCRSRTLTNHT